MPTFYTRLARTNASINCKKEEREEEEEEEETEVVSRSRQHVSRRRYSDSVRGFLAVFMCLFVCLFFHMISQKKDAARITILNVEMFHHES